MQTAALEEPTLVREIAERFGSQAIVVSVDVKRSWLGKRELYAAATGKTLRGSWLEHMQALVAAGAGWFWDRTNCCLWYQTSGGRYCDNCSLVDVAELRAQRERELTEAGA